MKAAAIVVGAVSCLVGLPALAAGLLYLSVSPQLGLVLIGIGVISVEGGVYLIRRADDPRVLAVSSPAVGGAIALAFLALGGYAATLGAARAPEDDPAWLGWALYAAAGLCGWIGLRAGWHALSGPGKGPPT
jgi:hypothetical protein